MAINNTLIEMPAHSSQQNKSLTSFLKMLHIILYLCQNLVNYYLQYLYFLNFSCIIYTTITVLCIVHFVFFTAFYYGKQIMWSVSRSRGLFPVFPTSKGLFPVFPTSKGLFPTSEARFPENLKKTLCYINVSNWLNSRFSTIQFPTHGTILL